MGEALAEARLAAERGEQPERRRRGRQRRDGRPGPRPGARDERPDGARRHGRAPRSRPPAGDRPARRRRRSSPRSSRARCASGRSSRATSTELVYAVPNRTDGAAGTVLQLAQHSGAPPSPPGRQRHPPRRGRGAPRARDRAAVRGPLAGLTRDLRPTGLRGPLWYPLARRGVRVVDGAALEKRCAKAPRVRIPPSPPKSSGRWRRRGSASRPRRARAGSALRLPTRGRAGRGRHLRRGRLVA